MEDSNRMVRLRVQNDWKTIGCEYAKDHMRFIGDRGIARLRMISGSRSCPAIISNDRCAMGLH
tara:strand:+ start:96 stop:284 length:189 start_codon:yes stop_codon:yes gene_type:complete